MKNILLIVPVILFAVTALFLISVQYNQHYIVSMINTIQGYKPNFSDEYLLQKLRTFNEVNSFLKIYSDTLPVITVHVGHQQVRYSTPVDMGQVSLIAMVFDDKVKFMYMCEQNDESAIMSSPSIFDIEEYDC